MVDESLENHPDMLALREKARLRRARKAQIAVACAMLVVAVALITLAWQSVRPVEAGDVIEADGLRLDVINVIPASGARNAPVAEGLLLVGLVSGLQPDLTEARVRSLALGLAEKAAARRYRFASPGAGTRRREPDQVRVDCIILALERVPDNIPTLLSRVPSMSPDAPSTARLQWERAGSVEFEMNRTREWLSEFLWEAGYRERPTPGQAAGPPRDAPVP